MNINKKQRQLEIPNKKKKTQKIGYSTVNFA